MKNKLEFKNIHVQAENKTIVSDVSFVVEGGSLSVLMGPNGSGKSSLVNAIMGHPLYHLSKGNVFLDGEDITHITTDEKAKKGLFLSLQHIPKVGGVTLATFLHKAYMATHESDISILEFYLELRDKVQKYGIDPDFLDRPLTAGLSGGEKKLSEVIQLIALRPRFAILDEIDSGVDIDALHTVFNVIEALRKEGTAFVIISHYPSLLDHLSPEHVHVMSNGKLIRSGAKELATQIINKGFCMTVECKHAKTCSGTCSAIVTE